METNFEPGQKVHYDNGYGKKENGIIKSRSELNEDTYFVTFHPEATQFNYMSFTGIGTKVRYLRDGWVEKEEEK